MNREKPIIPVDEGAKFLARDYDQCFAQLRHYDSQIWMICRFAFTAYVAIVGTVMGIYQYSLDQSIDLVPVAVCILGIAFVLGVMVFGLLIRNRVYFVAVCRYINEHRGLFLADEPLGFANSSGMYVDARRPAYFNWRSWQSFLTYITALLNSGLVTLLAVYTLGHSGHWPHVIALGFIVLVGQVGTGIWFLTSRERDESNETVSGKE